MSYYLGCRIPRLSDCDDNIKCLKGIYCRGLEVLSCDYERIRYTRFNGDQCKVFDTAEEAKDYLSKIINNDL